MLSHSSAPAKLSKINNRATALQTKNVNVAKKKFPASPLQKKQQQKSLQQQKQSLQPADSFAESIALKLERIKTAQAALPPNNSINSDISECVDLIDLALFEICEKLDEKDGNVSDNDILRMRIEQLEQDLKESENNVVQLRAALADDILQQEEEI